MITFSDIQEAAERIRDVVVHTPTVACSALSKITNAEIFIKLENLQAVASFKERGAANKLAQLTEDERKRGVIAVSAGNHAQGVARHASLLGINAVIVMPSITPISKIQRTEGWGAKVLIKGETLAESVSYAIETSKKENLTFIHPYNDKAVIAGQGSAAVEMLGDIPHPLDYLVIPVGGGGLISGCSIATKAISPKTKIIGVEVENFASLQHFPKMEPDHGGPTIAEGIAITQVGDIDLEIIRQNVSQIIVVTETQVESAITVLVEAAKQVTEGAGAVGFAAILTNPDVFKGKRVGVILSGGNIDTRILANTMLRSLEREGRLLTLRLDIPDKPGALASLTTKIGALQGNIIEISHQRLFSAPSVQTAELDILIEARNIEHANKIRKTIYEEFTLLN